MPIPDQVYSDDDLFDYEDDFDKCKIGMCCGCGRSFSKSETVMAGTNIGIVELCYRCADECEDEDD